MLAIPIQNPMVVHFFDPLNKISSSSNFSSGSVQSDLQDLSLAFGSIIGINFWLIGSILQGTIHKFSSTFTGGL